MDVGIYLGIILGICTLQAFLFFVNCYYNIPTYNIINLSYCHSSVDTPILGRDEEDTMYRILYIF